MSPCGPASGTVESAMDSIESLSSACILPTAGWDATTVSSAGTELRRNANAKVSVSPRRRRITRSVLLLMCNTPLVILCTQHTQWLLHGYYKYGKSINKFYHARIGVKNVKTGNIIQPELFYELYCVTLSRNVMQRERAINGLVRGE